MASEITFSFSNPPKEELQTQFQKIFIEISGPPIPYAAARKGKYGRWYNPRSKEKRKIRWVIRSQYHGFLLKGPLEIRYLFEMPIPKSWPKAKKDLARQQRIAHVSRPDVDNLLKFYNDCMKNIIYEDDRQIVRPLPFKFYGASPRTLVVVYYEEIDEKEID